MVSQNSAATQLRIGTLKQVYAIISVDESWILYAYDPDSKQQSTVWV